MSSQNVGEIVDCECRRRTVKVRLQIDYELEIPLGMKMEEVKEQLVDKFFHEDELDSVGIRLVDRTDEVLKRLRKKS